VLIFVVALACMALVRTASATSIQEYDQNACMAHGGVRGIANPFHYFFVRWPVKNDGTSRCMNCPQCIRYCYEYTLVCNDDASLTRYTQVQPFLSQYGDRPTYISEVQQSGEWSAIQGQEQHDNTQFSSTAAWENLSPIPQFLILGLSIALTFVAWRGLGDDDWRMAPLGIFNLYLPVSLLFFNTTAKGSSGFAYWLDTTLFFHSWLFFAAFVGFVAVGVQPFIQGWDYLFVKHPAEPVIEQALSSGEAIDHEALASALTPDPAEFDDPKPAWHNKHQAERARALKAKLEEDGRLADAAIERERARTTATRNRALPRKVE
jgi:Pyruvate/2-oxoacid:ferredoxin oxidoreductase delta subunit